MAPVYFDELNMVENMHHHYRSLGGYTYAFLDYYHAGITQFLDDPAIESSLLVMDVLTFAHRYEKFQLNYIINAGNDEFFMLGNPHYFFDQLGDETLFRVIPNQGHGGVSGGKMNSFELPSRTSRRIDTDSLWHSMESLFAAKLWAPHTIPKIRTTIENSELSSNIQMESSKQPNFVRIWRADSLPGRRDWRLNYLKTDNGVDKVCNVQELVEAIAGGLAFDRNPNIYTHENIEAESNIASFEMSAIEQEIRSIWRAGFIEMEFDLNGRKFNLTTIPAIAPFDSWPVEDCKTPEECTGCLV